MVSRFAQVVNAQENENISRNRWTNMAGCVSIDGVYEPTGESWSSFTKTPITGTVSKKTQYTYLHPYTVTGHQFRLNIPDNAYIKNIKFVARMRATASVPAPYGMFCIYGNAWNTRKSDNAPEKTGWYNGLYRVHLNNNLSNNWIDLEYNMNEPIVQQAGITPAILNDDKMGVDLIFKDSNVNGSCVLKWIKCIVDYVVPEHLISFDKGSSYSNPYEYLTGTPFDLTVNYVNPTPASDGEQVLDVDLPFGTHILSYSTENSQFDSNTNKWTVNGNAGQSAKLNLRLQANVVGLRELTVSRNHIDGKADVNSAKFYHFGLHDIMDGEMECVITHDELRKGVRGCFHIQCKAISSTGVIRLAGEPNDSDLIVFPTSDLVDSGYIRYILNENESSQGVSMDTSEFKNSGWVKFNIPKNEEVILSFDICLIPLKSGENFKWSIATQGKGYSNLPHIFFDVKEPYTYVVTSKNTRGSDIFNMDVNPANIQWLFPRISPSIEFGVTAFECTADKNSNTLLMSECNLKMHNWEVVPYIASVPVQHPHFDPRSDFENPLLTETYKSKKYSGKENVISEKITLNLRVNPAQVTTLQGYAEMDKPVPINLVPTAFEGDALNHRGWAELTKIGNVEKTNPLYYKIECDVDYITHNINTKFEITTGSYTNSDPLPNVLSEVLANGEPLSDGLITDDSTNDFFNVNTDGNYLYDDTSLADLRNIFSLGEGQHLYIKSNEPLSQNVEINFGWLNNKLSENKSNRVTRIFRLRDKDTNNPIFEYAYHNISFDGDYVSCQVIGTRLTETLGTIEEINQSMDLRTDVESEDTGADEVEPELDEIITESMYGSTLRFILNNNVLTVIDKGNSGREVYKANIELNKGSYYYEVEIVNENISANDDDILMYVDIQVLDTVLQTEYADLYSKLLVCPFPVADKKLVFTREAEDGTIYYFYDDGLPAKYRVDPYYQYHNGVDLQANDGIQIFNLNNSYETFYIQNGLIRVGFNRFSGYMYLAKWDVESQKYITTNTFNLGSDVKFDLKPISDDCIELMVNEAVFTVWRGHPYVMINHENMDIKILTKFSSIFGEKVAGQKAETLSNFLLLNTDNLLPSCVGSNNALKSDCVSVVVPEDDILHKTETVFEDTEVEYPANATVSFKAKVNKFSESTPLIGNVVYMVNGIEIGSAEINEYINYTFPSADTYTIHAIYTGDDNFKWSISEAWHVLVKQPEPTESARTEDTITGQFTLECIEGKDVIEYMDNSVVRFQLKRGNTPVPDKIIELDHINGATYTDTTDSNGVVSAYNNREVAAGNHKWAARFYDYHNEDGVLDTLLVKAEKNVTVTKAKTKITLVSPSNGKMKRGKKSQWKLTRTLHGVEEPFANQTIIFTVNNANRIIKKTNSSGIAYLYMAHKGNRNINAEYMGNAYYKKSTLSKTIVVS